MTLSLAEAVTLLGRSQRQVRYLIKTGRLPARKVEGRWQIDDADLPLTDAQRQAIASRVEKARVAFEKETAAAEKLSPSKDRRSYSVTDFKAFQSGEAILRRDLGREDQASEYLFRTLSFITLGCPSGISRVSGGGITTSRAAITS